MLGSLFNKVTGLRTSDCIKKETPTQVVFCEYCKTLKNNFLYRTPPVAASKDLTLLLTDTE